MARDKEGVKKQRKPLSRRQKSKIKLAVLGAEVVVLGLLMVALFLVQKIQLIDTDTDFNQGGVQQNELQEEVKEKLEGYTNIALLGLDNRSVGNYDWGNADTIIIASINNETKEVKLVSVYRDTYMQVTEEGKYSKINSAYNSNGGAKGMVEALNRNLDLDIQDYVSVDWYAVIKTVDLLGGIEVELTSTEANVLNGLIADGEEVTGFQTDRVAKKGMNKLDGVQALAFARMRSLVGDDYARTERQRLVIGKMLEKAKKASAGTLVKIIDEVFPSISTSMTSTELIALAAGVMDYNLTETTGFPEERGSSSAIGGYSIIPVSLLTNVEDLHEFLFENDKYIPSVQLQEISNTIIKKSGLAPKEEEPEE